MAGWNSVETQSQGKKQDRTAKADMYSIPIGETGKTIGGEQTQASKQAKRARQTSGEGIKRLALRMGRGSD